MITPNSTHTHDPHCIFCRIILREIPTRILYEDEYCLAFQDISPKAKVHLLLIPKKHVASLLDLTEQDAALMGHLTTRIPSLAREFGLHQGFRTQVNTGKRGGQEVFHLHYHLLGDPSP